MRMTRDIEEQRAQRDQDDSNADDSYYYFPVRLGPALPHYYGDYVRKLFMGGAVLILICAPFLRDYVPFALPFEIVGAVIVIVLGALTSPKKRWVMACNAVVSSMFILAFEAFAFYAYAQGDTLVFMVRELLAIIFVFALYFSGKTLRAMLMQQIGMREPPGEFLKPTLSERWRDTRSWL